MNINGPFFYFILLGLGMMILEIAMGAATGFDLLLVGVAFIISGLLGQLTDSFTVSLISVLVLLALYLLVLRRFVKQVIHIDTKKTNTDNLFGKTANVIKKIVKDKPGQIKLEGEIWRAEADETCEVGDKVIVKSVSGVTLRVAKLN